MRLMKTLGVALTGIALVAMAGVQPATAQLNDCVPFADRTDVDYPGGQCMPFLKQVSVDGGSTWINADDEGSAALASVGAVVEYRYILTNCENQKKCENTTITDPLLDIFDQTFHGSGNVKGFIAAGGFNEFGDACIVDADTVVEVSGPGSGITPFSNLRQTNFPTNIPGTAGPLSTSQFPGPPQTVPTGATTTDECPLVTNWAHMRTETEGEVGAEHKFDPANVECEEEPPEPQIEICTLVTLNPDMVSDFSDADTISGDGCDEFSQLIPVGTVNEVDGTYRLKVTNTGTEELVNVQIVAPDFFGDNTPRPIPPTCGSLTPGEMCVIDFDEPAFDLPVSDPPALKMLDICEAPGTITKLASVEGEGKNSGTDVSDDDPATVECVGEPAIDLRKQVRFDPNGDFEDADTVATAVPGALGADAEYRLIVENIGTVDLANVVINDPILGLSNVTIPGGGNLAVGDIVTIVQGDAGFSPLLFEDRCEMGGNFLNTATVQGDVVDTPDTVSDNDDAWVTCDTDPDIDILKEVSIDGGVTFFDANQGDADIPVGLVGITDALYRLTVTNIGDEPLVNVTVEDVMLGIPETVITDLAVGQMVVIESGDTGFGGLSVDDVCEEDNVTVVNVATTTGFGENSGEETADTDPANVICITGPAIDIVKEVSIDGGVTFFDANTPAEGPTGLLGADALYQLTVSNIGDEPLTNVLINDATLGLVNVLIDDLGVGDSEVIDSGTFGFENLDVPGRCDSIGNFLNMARVDADGSLTGTPVSDEDPANVNCDVPGDVCTIAVDKTCLLPPPPPSDNLLCESSISATTLRYTGPTISNATVVFEGDKDGSATYSGVDLVSGVTILTMAGQNGFTVDAGAGEKLGSKTRITINGVEEVIHTSCSAIYEAGQPAPLDGQTPGADKGDPSPNWTVVNFRDKDDEFVQVPVTTTPTGADACEFACQPPPTGGVLCESSISATTLRYIGPDIDGATVVFEGDKDGFAQYDGVDLVGGVTVLTSADENGFTIDAGLKDEDEGEKLGSKTFITINGQEEVIHTSCSAIYEAGAPAPLDGQTPGADKGDPSPNWFVVNFRDKEGDVGQEPGEPDECQSVAFTYAYEVSNIGTSSVEVTSVDDDQLGELLTTSPTVLGPGDQVVLSSGPVSIGGETTNVVNVLANVEGDAGLSCTATDTVTVTPGDPPPVPVRTCDDGKPVELVFEYTAGGCGATTQDQEGKLECEGGANGAAPVQLREEKSETNPSGEVLQVGDLVRVMNEKPGKKLKGGAEYEIVQNGDVIETIKIHQSCSKPLNVGDTFGSLTLRGFIPEGGQNKASNAPLREGRGATSGGRVRGR